MVVLFQDQSKLKTVSAFAQHFMKDISAKHLKDALHSNQENLVKMEAKLQDF